MRGTLSGLLLGASLVFGGGASASTIAADFFASSTVSYNLLSATRVGSGLEAGSQLVSSGWDGGGDQGGFSEGDIYGSGAFVETTHPSGYTNFYSTQYIVGGTVSEHTPESYVGLQTYELPNYFNAFGCYDTCGHLEDIRLTFSYTLSTIASTNIYDPAIGTAQSYANGELRFDVIPNSSSNGGSSQSPSSLRLFEGSGLYTVVLSPSDELQITVFTDVGGFAEYIQPAPIPLPAGAPLLLTALGAFAWMRRRKAIAAEG